VAQFTNDYVCPLFAMNLTLTGADDSSVQESHGNPNSAEDLIEDAIEMDAEVAASLHQTPGVIVSQMLSKSQTTGSHVSQRLGQ